MVRGAGPPPAGPAGGHASSPPLRSGDRRFPRGPPDRRALSGAAGPRYSRSMQRLLVVINPSSSDFEAERRFPELDPILRSLAHVTVVETDRDDQKTLDRIAGALHEGPDRVL